MLSVCWSAGIVYKYISLPQCQCTRTIYDIHSTIYTIYTSRLDDTGAYRTLTYRMYHMAAWPIGRTILDYEVLVVQTIITILLVDQSSIYSSLVVYSYEQSRRLYTSRLRSASLSMAHQSSLRVVYSQSSLLVVYLVYSVLVVGSRQDYILILQKFKFKL